MTESVTKKLRAISLPHVCEGDRFKALDTLDAYFKNKQYDHLRYDWDGNFCGYSDGAVIAAGFVVAHKLRKPSTTVQSAKLIVTKLTAMLLGEDTFPEFNVPGDSEAEDYLKTLIEESKFQTKWTEARDKGGACGTSCMSFAFIDGKPRVEVHDAKHMQVIAWKDRYEFRPRSILKTYFYIEQEVVDGKPKDVKYYYARLWTEDTETIWDPIPEKVAKEGNWVTGVKSYTARHNYGECPVYWSQNLANSDQVDGLSDYDGLCDNFDQINCLMSSTGKGTIANVDPTLVIKMDPSKNHGAIRKGSENAIYSPGGADYLELKGESIKTATGLTGQILQHCLDVAGVVVGDPEKVSGAAQSAAAMRMLYKPMINQCNKLRPQYGKELAIPLLLGMLRAARKINGTPGEIFTTTDGRRVQENSIVILPPKVVVTNSYDEAKKANVESVETIQRVPGTSEVISLQWPQYFEPTQADVNQAVEAATNARGILISDKTATRYVARPFGVVDVDAEIETLTRETDARAETLLSMESEFSSDDEIGSRKSKEDSDEE